MPQSAQRTHIAMGPTVYTHASRSEATPLRDESCDLDCKITDARPACRGRRDLPRQLVLAVTCAALLLGHATAFADCESGLPRTDLAEEQRRAGQWNLAWRIANTAGATAQFAVAASGVADHDTTRALWISGAATTVGALVSWLIPLEISVPPASDDRCVEDIALRAAVARGADDERRAFWFQHAGSLAVNLGAAVAIAETVSWQAAARSFAIGYSVSLLQTYTMPRAMWRHRRSYSLRVQAIGAVGVAIAGRF